MPYILILPINVHLCTHGVKSTTFSFHPSNQYCLPQPSIITYTLSHLITSDNESFHFKVAYKLLQAQTFLKICFRNQPRLWFVNYKFLCFSLFILGKYLGNTVWDCTLFMMLGTVQTHVMRSVKTLMCKDFSQREKTKSRSGRYKEAMQSSPQQDNRDTEVRRKGCHPEAPWQTRKVSPFEPNDVQHNKVQGFALGSEWPQIRIQTGRRNPSE